MTPSAIVEILSARGARLVLLAGDRIAVTPRAAVDDKIRQAIREQKAPLVALLTGRVAIDYAAIYATLATDAGTVEDLEALRQFEPLDPLIMSEIAWLDCRGDRLAAVQVDEAAYRAAVLLLVARLDSIRRWHHGAILPPTHRRLVFEKNAPVSAPITLPDGTVVENVGRFLGRVVDAVDYALARSDVAGDDVLDVYLEQLAVLGIKARVEVVQ